MSIDKKIDDLIEALNRNTAALEKAGAVASSAATDKPTETKTAGKAAGKATAEKKEDKAPEITQEQANAALIKIKDEFGLEEAKKVISENSDATKMSDIKPKHYKAVYDAAVARYEELAAGGSDDGGL